METTQLSWFAHVRGVLVGIHLLAVTLLALPAPQGGMNRANWADPAVQDELAAWTARLNDWGIAVTQPELEEQLWEAASNYMRVRREVLRPIRPYESYCGTGQSWRMFVAPHRYPAQLHIDVEEGEWRPVYVERDPFHRWQARQLDSYRFRSVIFRLGWESYYEEYRQFVDWLAILASKDFPKATRLRVRFAKYRILSPDEVRARNWTDVRFVLEETRNLKALR